jgi:Rha family phage regulatory protein
MSNDTTDLVLIHGQKLVTTSLLVADKFKKTHTFVLKKSANLKCSSNFRKVNYDQRDYIDARGKVQPMIEMTEEGFLFIAMRFTGEDAVKWQEKFIFNFQMMRKRLNEPGRSQAIQYKRNTAGIMTDAIKLTRDDDDKLTNDFHYGNEHKFCNRFITGEFKPLDESILDVYDATLLGKIRERSAMLYGRYPKQIDRKLLIEKFVQDYRLKNPKNKLLD